MFYLKRLLSTQSILTRLSEQISLLYEHHSPSSVQVSTLTNLMNLYNKASSQMKIDWKDSLRIFIIFNRSKFKFDKDRLEEELLKNLESFDASSLVDFSKYLITEQGKSEVLNHVSKNFLFFSPVQLTKIATFLKNEEMLIKLADTRKINFDDMSILASAIEFSSNFSLLVELCRISERLSSTVKCLPELIKIIEIFDLKYPDLASNLVSNLESQLFETEKIITFNEIQKIMKFFRLEGIHLLFSPRFKLQFEALVLNHFQSLTHLNASLHLYIMTKEEYYSFDVYSKLIEKLIQSDPKRIELKQLIKCFQGISKVHFFNESLQNYFKSIIINSMHLIQENDLLKILKTMIYQNYYDQELLDLVLKNLKSSISGRKISSTFLFHSLLQLKIDCPKTSEICDKMLANISENTNTKVSISKTQEYISEILKSFNYEFKECSIIHGIYEADFLIEKQKIIVEAIGTLYHFSDMRRKLSPREISRVRHLVKLGYKIILSVNRESTEKFLKKAMFILNNFKDQHAIILLEDRIEIIDALSNKQSILKA